MGPLAGHVTAVIDRELLYTSGMAPIEDGKPKYQGRVGAEVSLEKDYKASRINMINKAKAQ
jgi:hypothetical protein